MEAQRANIRRLAEAGEVGLILFYVGVFMPEVDQSLLELADWLEFPLIVMPEHRMDQRYSEVICEVMEAICDALVADYYEGELVIFMNWSRAVRPEEMAAALTDQLETAGLEAVLITCQDLQTTADVRQAYLAIRAAQGDAERIWPGRRRYSIQEIRFAHSCRETVERGEDAVQQALAPLARTLQAYLLDADRSTAAVAALLFLHKNTVKYRLQRINACLGHPADKLPEVIQLYAACALIRLLAC